MNRLSIPPSASSTALLGGLSALGVSPTGPRNEAISNLESAHEGQGNVHMSTTQNTPIATSPTPEDAREEQGLRAFQEGLQKLYKETMLKSGYSTEETQPSSQSYRRFAFLAWQQECMRLQMVLGEEPSPDAQFSAI